MGYEKCKFHLCIRFLNCSGYTSRANELQKLIDIKGKKNLDSVGQKEDQCIAYIREKNVAKIEELTKSCVLGDFIHHSIINMHIEMGSTELALDHLDEVRKSRPNFKLDRSEAARLACAMYKEEREWREIIRIFTENKQLRLQSDNVTAIYHFLQSVAETGNAAELNELVDVLIDNNFLVKDNQSAGYMVKVHLVNNDLVQAVRTFEKQYDERKFTSHHVPLAVALIKANEMEKLRKVFKLMESKYSEANALLTLVISFIECGNIGLARVLLKNASSRISDNSFNNYWARYHKYGEYSVLQGVLDATVGLDYDRCNIYSYLLVHYCDQKRTEDALELWRKQRDQNEQPTNGFLQRLAAHLDENGIKYPFQVPKADTPTLASHSLPAENEMKNALRNKDIDAALKMWNKINSNSTRYEYLASGLIQLLCKSNRNTEAFDIATQTIDLEKRVNDAAFCDLIQRIADDGNWQSLERLGDSLSHTTKRAIRFGGELLRAYEKNGKWNEFFGKTLEKIKMNANVNERVLQSNLLKHLQKQSIPLDECECVFQFHTWQRAIHINPKLIFFLIISS